MSTFTVLLAMTLCGNNSVNSVEPIGLWQVSVSGGMVVAAVTNKDGAIDY